MAGPVFHHQTAGFCRDRSLLTAMRNIAKYGYLNHIMALYMGFCCMLRPLLTYGLLTLSISALALFNVMT